MSTFKQPRHRLNQGFVDEIEQATTSEKHNGKVPAPPDFLQQIIPFMIYHHPAYMKVHLDSGWRKGV